MCFISAAAWPDLGLFVVSSYGGIPASCKIKWKMAHAHSKSEIAGPLCTVCVLRVPHCSKRALQQGGESGRTVLSVPCTGSAASPIFPFSNFTVDKLQMMFLFPVFFLSDFLALLVSSHHSTQRRFNEYEAELLNNYEAFVFAHVALFQTSRGQCYLTCKLRCSNKYACPVN